MQFHFSTDWIEYLGWFASLLTIVTYSMNSMIPLRIFAITSSVGFLVYALLLQLWPVFLMELILLPINCYRFWQILRLRNRISELKGDEAPDFSVVKTYGTRKTFAAGQIVFERGDPVDQLYYLAEGRVAVEGLDVEIGPGGVFGEIAFFTDAAVRTATVRCLEDVVVYEVDRKRFLTLQFEDPSFGLSIMRTITRRLIRDGHPLAQAQATPG